MVDRPDKIISVYKCVKCNNEWSFETSCVCDKCKPQIVTDACIFNMLRAIEVFNRVPQECLSNQKNKIEMISKNLIEILKHI